MEDMTVHIIAHIRTEFPTKFGVPRQSGLAETVGEVVFTPEYRNADALRGIADYEYLWLVWVFDQAIRNSWSPTVRPPRLGGNRRMGVFATRSPFRPNPIGLSSVRLLEVRKTEKRGTVLTVSGADLMDGTPILDIKPYLAYTDAHPGVRSGFADEVQMRSLDVVIPEACLSCFPPEQHNALRSVLAGDPRPHYQNDPERIYGFVFAGYEIRFSVEGDTLTVREIFKQ